MMADMRWKVLIVDDEFRIGQLIKRLIKWEELFLECVDVLDNGEAAYEMILKKKPDIVITDIRMPKINGLELVRMTNEVRDDIRFIIISGYKEFEYAHKALQYGVNNYLLKPINEAELNEVLNKVIAELSENNAVLKQQAESNQIIRRDLLNHIIETKQPTSLSEVEQEYNVKLNAPLYRGIDIKLDYSDHEKTNKKQDRITVDKVLSIVEQHLRGCVNEELICEKPGMHIYCLFNYESDKVKDIKGFINDILSEIQDYLLGFEQYVVTIGVGNEKDEFAAIGTSIAEAQKAVGNRIKLGVGRLIYADALSYVKTEDTAVYLQPYKDSFLAAMEAYSQKNLTIVINKIFSPFQLAEDIDFSSCYTIAEELVKIFFENIGIQSKEGDNLKERLLMSVNQCYTILNLKMLLKQKLGEYLETSRKLLETESIRPIRKAKKYIGEHYAEKIVLEDIAELVDLNPVYFSVLFKKETGMNFSVYLIHIRMEHAKQMLRKGNETIAAIAEQVGYKDSRYFSQTFAKTVGVKPALYRKLHT